MIVEKFFTALKINSSIYLEIWINPEYEDFNEVLKKGKGQPGEQYIRMIILLYSTFTVNPQTKQSLKMEEGDTIIFSPYEGLHSDVYNSLHINPNKIIPIDCYKDHIYLTVSFMETAKLYGSIEIAPAIRRNPFIQRYYMDYLGFNVMEDVTIVVPDIDAYSKYKNELPLYNIIEA